MSTALSTRVEALPTLATPPKLSGSLSRCVDLLTDPDNPYRHHVTVGERDAVEASQRLSQIEHMCRGAPAAIIAAWCKQLVPHLAKAPNREEFPRAVEGIAIACHDLPYAVWTSETVSEALKTQTWWPTPADVRRILLPFATPLWKIRNGLTCVVRMADKAFPAEASGPVTDDAREHVAAVVKAFVAERTFSQPAGAPTKDPIKALPLSDGAQLAEYERIASEDGPFASAAAHRAAMIRVKIGRPVGSRI